MALLNGKRVNDTEIDPSKHKFIGMFRPPDYTSYQGKGLIRCQCGSILETYQESYSHWLHGHFDEPQYVDIHPGE